MIFKKKFILLANAESTEGADTNKFPYMRVDNKRYYTGCFDSIEAVAFRDINDDGKEDTMTEIMLLISNLYFTRAA